MSDFFTKHEASINKFIKYTEKMKDTNEYTLYSLELCAGFLSEILQTRKFAEMCKFNIENIGASFKNDINSNYYDEFIYESILIFLIRIAKEYELSSNISLKKNGSKLLEKFKKSSEVYSSELNNQIYYTWEVMPFQIINFQNNLKFNT